MKSVILAAAALGLSVTAANATCAGHDDVADVDQTTVASIANDKKSASTTASTTDEKKAAETIRPGSEEAD